MASPRAMELHNTAKETYTANIDDIGQHLTKSTHILIAIERHDAGEGGWNFPKDRFLWVKARKKTPIQQVRDAYVNSCSPERRRTNIKFTMNDAAVATSSTAGELDFFGDQVVVLQIMQSEPASVQSQARKDSTPTARQASTAASDPPAPKSSGTPVRQPLQSVRRQLNVPPQQSPDDLVFRKSPNISDNPGQASTVKGPDDRVKKEHSHETSTPRFPNLAMSGLHQASLPSNVPQEVDFNNRGDAHPHPEPKLENDVLSQQSNDYEPKPHVNPFLEQEDEVRDVTARGQPLRQLAEDSSPERLEASVRSGVEVLSGLEASLKQLGGNTDAAAFLQQIEAVRKEAVKSRTVVGVVGNTGAGKSSVINAMLEEERLVPTNCMRACTAVVTELSYNHSKLESSKYRAEIEFITPDEWRKELNILVEEVFDDSGRVVHDARDPDSQAGIAYAKIRAVYNKYTQEMLGKASVDKLMREQSVQSVLGTIRRVNERTPDTFYKRLQIYVDSREKGEEKLDKNGNKIGLRKRRFEFWPLIKVVRIYTKADALSTGAVLVDLPGVHDSNAARAAVAEGYMKQTTGLWILAPINRAVDDKAAQKLLGDTFKRQLKFDGTYSAVTFICSKTDDISRTEATDSLELGEEMTSIEERLRGLSRQRKELSSALKEAKGKKTDCENVIEDVEDKLEVWDGLKDKTDEGKTVYPPSEQQKKRKRAARTSTASRKKRRGSSDSDDEVEVISSDDDDDDDDDGAEGKPARPPGPPLTSEQVDEKLDELKALKKDVRRAKSIVDDQIRDLRKRVQKIEQEEDDLDNQAEALCIAGRNNYSRAAIKNDFAAGIRELDMETAEDENPEDFNPDEDLRDYDEVARSLPVFCVSSRAYQKLSGRLQKDSEISGFTTLEQTEIPQLQAHCKKLTEHGRTATCRRFLNSLNRLVSSLALWASDDGSSPRMNAQQHDSEQRYFNRRLQDLENALKKTVNSTVGDVQETMAGYVFNQFVPAVEAAVKAAHRTQAGWGAHRNDGGLFWATYKATTRRSGVFQGASGLRDFNTELAEPMMKQLQNQWEKTFQRKLPLILQSFSKSGNTLLKDFHAVIETRCRESGHGIARIDMLGVGLRNYEHVFNDASSTTINFINERQRHINREFVPQITDIMQAAYNECVDINGKGSYARMKSAMERFVGIHKTTMFQQACDEVKNRLTTMCGEVRKTMLDRVDGVFVNMKRDYSSLIGGVDLGQVQIPWEERSAKRELDDRITAMDEQFQRVIDADPEGLREPQQDGQDLEEEEGDAEDAFEFEDEDEDQEDQEQDNGEGEFGDLVEYRDESRERGDEE